MTDMNRQRFLSDHLLALSIVEAVLRGDVDAIDSINATAPIDDIVNGLTLVASTLMKSLAASQSKTDQAMIDTLRLNALEHEIRKFEEE